MNRQTRRDFIKISSAGALGGLIGTGVLGSGVLSGCRFIGRPRRPNVLFIIVDDLRPELGCYGNGEIQTSRFDRFAREGTVFTRAHCQAAACSPSRASAMTGLRPDSTRVWSLGEEFRKTVPDVVTMPQHFHAFGYHTVSLGKIFHNHMPDRISWDEPDLRPVEYMTPELIDRDPESFYYDEELKKELAAVREKRIKENPNRYAGGWAYGRSTECSEAPDNAFYDGAQTDLALETLRRIKDGHQPFFMALGYYRPHLPFVAPKKYWDLYDRESLSLARNPYLPEDAPVMAADSSYELKGCYDLEFVGHPSVYTLPEDIARRLKHGYYASVSYIDACLGRILDGLEEMGISDNTIVILWGDHGYKLGEHNAWTKQTNYNIDTRVPLIVRAPGSGRPGRSCDRLVELVDLYPTLCDLSGIRVPGNMEGVSFKPLLRDPERRWKSAVFSQYHRRPNVSPDGRRYMGFSMVTERYHYVEWRDWDNDVKTAGALAAVELYDNAADPDENANIAVRPENAELLAGLSEQLRAGWRTARPA
jgi:iduronate 2-sulfatase